MDYSINNTERLFRHLNYIHIRKKERKKERKKKERNKETKEGRKKEKKLDPSLNQLY